MLELRVHSSDLGKVIGREGRMVKAIRDILGSVGRKLQTRVTVNVVE